MKKIVIIGAGGHAREILDILEACNSIKPSYEILGYIVESEYGSPGSIVNDKPILGDFEWFDSNKNNIYAICGVGSPQLRLRLTKRAMEKGVQFCNIIHPSATVTSRLSLGEGVVISAGCILTNQILIGNHVHLNLLCTIGHDAILHDYVTLTQGVHISGHVILGSGCYIGTGANIIDRIQIGEWSIIGAGSTVINNVPPNVTVVGIPGKVIKSRPDKWHLE